MTKWTTTSLVRAAVVALAVMLAAAGCASFAYTVPTRAPAGRSAADVARDTRECEARARVQPDGKEDHYDNCMLQRGYAVNLNVPDVAWFVGVVEGRPRTDHGSNIVGRDKRYCGRLADNAKNTDVIPLTPAQEARIVDIEGIPGTPIWRRPTVRTNAARMLVACLDEHGYVVVPWVRFQDGQQ